MAVLDVVFTASRICLCNSKRTGEKMGLEVYLITMRCHIGWIVFNKIGKPTKI